MAAGQISAVLLSQEVRDAFRAYVQRDDGSLRVFSFDGQCAKDWEKTVARGVDYEVLLILVFVCLLRGDVGLITPTVLPEDYREWERTGDIALVEKARSAGCIGWDIGGNLHDGRGASLRNRSRSGPTPHYRKPHWTHVRTGKGREKVEYVPRIGSFVNARDILEVPSGWYSQRAKRCPFCLATITSRAHYETCQSLFDKG
jgi:hypothetical protein